MPTMHFPLPVVSREEEDSIYSDALKIESYEHVQYAQVITHSAYPKYKIKLNKPTLCDKTVKQVSYCYLYAVIGRRQLDG